MCCKQVDRAESGQHVVCECSDFSAVTNANEHAGALAAILTAELDRLSLMDGTYRFSYVTKHS